MDNSLPQIAEVIVVEGRDDTAAIRRAVRAVTIETHGFGISKSTWEKIERAYHDYGIIVFTDPDHAGEDIRRKILGKFPDAKQAFLSREKATEKTKSVRAEEDVNKARPDIGIENASPEDIREALEKAKARVVVPQEELEGERSTEDSARSTSQRTGVRPRSCATHTFTMSDIDSAGLSGGEGARERREKLGDILGIGYANAKGLLYKLNTLGIEKENFEEALRKL